MSANILRSADARWTRSVRSHFNTWLNSIDAQVRETISAPEAWAQVAVLALGVIAVAGIIPATRPFFQLRAVAALACFGPVITVGLGLGLLQRRGALTLMQFGLLALLCVACFQFFMWSLVALSRLPGASLLASLPVLLACYHGYALRTTLAAPYATIAMGVGALAAAAHAPAEVAPIFWVGIPGSLGTSFLLGHNSLAHHRERTRGVALREALDAQILSERARHVEELSQALGKLQGTSHDAGNALSGVLMNLEQLALEALHVPLSPERCARIGEMATDLALSLDVLRSLLLSARDASRESLPQLEKVAVTEVLSRIVAETSARFTTTRIVLKLETDNARSVLACLSGGESTLVRILANLLTNACEGDGSSRAREVLVTVLPPDDREIRLEILDDGPGFARTLLEGPVRELHTTKAGGSGLGLYVSDRLTRASGGTLRLMNRADRVGARVELTLQRVQPT